MKTLKNIQFAILFLSIFSISFAQESFVSLDMPMEDKDEVEVLNTSYLNSMSQSMTSPEAIYLEEIAARYDAKKAITFDQRKEPFTTVFKSDKGEIEITYDQEGKVVSSYERFRNISLPSNIKKALYHRYKEWKVVANKYDVIYKNEKVVKKTYELFLEKGDEQKRIRVNALKYL